MKRRQLIWALALALLPCLSNAADLYVYSSVALKPTRTLKDVKAIVPEEGGLRMSMADGNSEIVAWDQLAHFRFYAAEGTGVSALLPSAGLQVSSRGDALRISAPATMQRVTLISMSGQQVASYAVSGNTAVCPLQEMPQGVYVVKVFTADGVFTQKITRK